MEASLEEIVPTNLLKDSILCRLCGEENNNGTNIFDRDESGSEISNLINRYLPVKVDYTDDFPKTICPGCHIQLEATKLFMDLIIEGQKHLRELFRMQKEHLQREEAQRQKLEEALKAHNPNTSVETYTIQTDDTGEKYIIQIFSDGPLFPPEHELTLKAEGLDKPKRKRGRPPKSPQDPNKVKEVEEPQVREVIDIKEPEPDNDVDGRRRRKIKAPVRYEGVVHGKELDKILKNEGVIDDEDVDISERNQNTKDDYVPEEKNVIGSVITESSDYQEPIVFHRRQRIKSRLHKSALMKRRKRYECKICKKEFIHFGTYKWHVVSHRVQYICKYEGCSETDEDINVIHKHQLETGHEGISAIEKDENAGGNLELPPLLSTEPMEGIASESFGKPRGNQITCDLCNKTFTCKQNYEVHHRAIHSNDRPFKCELCKKSFSYANSLKAHSLKHVNEEKSKTSMQQFNCDKCDKVFHHPSSLCYHRDTEHNNGRRFVCSKCNKVFKHRQLLQRHQLVHSEDRPFQCAQCFQTFKTKSVLLNHQAVHTGLKKFVCVKCGQTFAHRTSLSLHQRWHDGYKPFECDVCHKSFTQKGNLAEHKRIHTGEKPFRCSYLHCGKSFTTSSQYKLHLKRHTGEKPWRCEYCSKTFLHRDTWKAHTRRHLNERPFKCKFCTRAFSESWALRRHERLHSGEKPYKCIDCGKCFSDSSNMTKHKKVHKANAEKSVFAASHLSEENENSELLKEETSENLDPTDDAPSLISILDPSVSVEREQSEMNPLELRQVLDPDGNPISFTTAEGQPISIVASGDSRKIQGLLPDGSLVSIDLGPEPSEKDGDQADLLDGIRFLTDDETDKAGGDKLEPNVQFLTEDGKVCFIAYDESELLTLI